MAKQALSKNSLQRVERIMKQVDTIRSKAAHIDHPRVTDLVRRAAIPIARDGYPANSMPESTSGGSISDPTGSTALAPDRDVSGDLVGRALRNLENDLRRAEKSVLDALGILDGEQRTLAKRKERPTSVPCSICLIQAAAKAGWCVPDYNDWYKHGCPDRNLWEMFKRRDVDENGVLRVPECPPPTTRQAIRGPWKA